MSCPVPVSDFGKAGLGRTEIAVPSWATTDWAAIANGTIAAGSVTAGSWMMIETDCWAMGHYSRVSAVASREKRCFAVPVCTLSEQSLLSRRSVVQLLCP